MNGQMFPGLYEQINRDAHERLIKEAAAARQARRAVAWLRFFEAKKAARNAAKEEKIVQAKPQRKTEPSPSRP